jgi:hypothetical protein
VKKTEAVKKVEQISDLDLQIEALLAKKRQLQ